MRKNSPEGKVLPARLRCAIYTRKSTEEGLEQDFNSLDAQREAAEAFIQSQRREGWIALPERYDDGGFTIRHHVLAAVMEELGDFGRFQPVLRIEVQPVLLHDRALRHRHRDAVVRIESGRVTALPREQVSRRTLKAPVIKQRDLDRLPGLLPVDERHAAALADSQQRVRGGRAEGLHGVPPEA